MPSIVRKGRPRAIGLACFSLCLVLTDLPALAQTVELVGEGRVTVRADGVILVTLLRELESVVPIEQILLDPAVDGKVVRITLEDVPFQEAIEEILAAAEVNHVVWGKDDGPFRIFAGSPHQTRPVPLSERASGMDSTGGPGGSPTPEVIEDVERPPERTETPERPTRPASAEAHLRVPPDGERLAMTLAILLIGFLSGGWLLGLSSRPFGLRYSEISDERS